MVYERPLSTVYNLNAHIKDHAKEENFKCSICDLGFRGQRLLDLHRRNSHGKQILPSYTCPHPGCSRSYFTQTDLARHKMTHDENSGGKKSEWICSACQKSFKIQSKLTQHERIHNGQRPFSCQHPGCQWSFRTSSKGPFINHVVEKK